MRSAMPAHAALGWQVGRRRALAMLHQKTGGAVHEAIEVRQVSRKSCLRR